MKILDAKDFEDMSPFFKGKWGQQAAGLIIRLSGFDRVNRLYANSGHLTGAAFANGILKELGVNYVVGNAGRLKLLPEGAFITVANHPYGGLDGVILIDLIAGIRPDYKLMVNRYISFVRTMKKNFISVTPAGNRKKGITGTSISGIRETLTHLKGGHPVGFFPSGAVSDLQLRNLRVLDRQWQESILHLIHRAKVPIVPIRFFDGNSPVFYLLGLINWRIRLLRQPAEIFNKGNRDQRIAIGPVVSVKEQEKFPDPVSLGAFLRKAVYDMPQPDEFIKIKTR
jgi:putative hemolysin